MRNYDYREAVCEDIRAYIKEHGFESEEQLNDDLWCEDSVTGNASGSYTFSAWQAEENLCHNMDLLDEACSEFGCEPKIDSAEWCDVTIRCYLLGECIGKVVSELLDEAESWWGELGFEDMERVTGFRQDDFSPEDGYQEFIDACDEWWNDLDENEKINIYLENRTMNKAEIIARYLLVCGTEAAVRMIVSKLLMEVADEEELLSAINARLEYEKLLVREDEEEE